jgi:hypothetical protein
MTPSNCQRAVIWLATALCVAVCELPARGDGGTVRASQRCGDFEVTVLTSPEPLREGPMEVSVLVQDAATGAPATDAQVAIELVPREQPQETERYQAARGAGTNKLFDSTTLVLPHAGWWHFGVELARGSKTAKLGFDAQAAPPLPRWQALWRWFTWPFLVMALFAAHQMLVHRAERRRPSLR